MPKPPGGAVTDHGIPDGLGDNEPDAGTALLGDTGVGPGAAVQHVDHDGAGTCAASTFDRPAEIGGRRELVLLR